jgi:hypothetical protein
MSEKNIISKAFFERFLNSTKKEKSHILDEFVRLTGLNRHYAAQKLAFIPGKVSKKFKKRIRRRFYDPAVVKALEKIWTILDYICGQRLVPILSEIILRLEKFSEIEISALVKQKLLSISSATVDRLLKPAKRLRGRKIKSNPGADKYLFDKIPIKTFGEWKNAGLGNFEVDLVAHNGGDVFGGFASTLNATDIVTAWTVSFVVRDKLQYHILKGFFNIRNVLPYTIAGIHSDNGSEFINETILKFCNKFNIAFTRGRPYKKNDNCHIEQKNNSVIRRNVGYLRYSSPEHLRILKELYTYLNVYTNYFQPVMFQISKIRQGAKVFKKYDLASTPFQRLMKRPEIPDLRKSEMQAYYETLNPAELKRNINRLQNELIKTQKPLVAKPNARRRVRRLQHHKPKGLRSNQTHSPNPFLEKQHLEEIRKAMEPFWGEKDK